MNIQDFIIGLMAFILCSIVVLLFTYEFYGTENLNIDLDADPQTATLSDMQDKVSEAQGNVTSSNSYMRQRTPGQEEVDLNTPDLQEGDLMKESLTALTKIPTYYEIFVGMLLTMFNSIGVVIYDFFWFFTGAIIVIITLILISSVLRNRL